MTVAGYMVDISNPGPWDFTGTSVIPETLHHLPRASAFYIGGNTPHVWTKEQIVRQSNRYRLPIWVYNPANSGAEHGKNEAEIAVKIAKELGVHAGKFICLDMETHVDHEYTVAFKSAVIAGGYEYTLYESEGEVSSANVKGDHGIWDANWTGTAHVNEGAWATQYASDKMLNHPFDISAVRSFDYLWDIKAAQQPPVINDITVDIKLVSKDGGKTWAVF